MMSCELADGLIILGVHRRPGKRDPARYALLDREARDRATSLLPRGEDPYASAAPV